MSVLAEQSIVGFVPIQTHNQQVATLRKTLKDALEDVQITHEDDLKTANELRYIFKQYHSSTKLLPGKVSQSPTFLLGFDNITDKVDLEFLTKCVLACDGRLCDLSIKMVGTPLNKTKTMAIEFEIWSAENNPKLQITRPHFIFPSKDSTSIVQDLDEKVISFFKVFKRPEDIVFIKRICHLVYNSSDSLPPIEMYAVESMQKASPSSQTEQLICDIQFIGMDLLRYSFLEHLFIMCSQRLVNLVITPTVDKELDIRFWLSQTICEDRMVPRKPRNQKRKMVVDEDDDSNKKKKV